MKLTKAFHIRHHRKTLGLSQAQYAEKYAVSLRTLQKWEQGINPVHPFFQGHVCWIEERKNITQN